ncbi:DUF1592 domain-containing protein [Haloferula rosea]|uniref:DUF1592 domain-containing protein n=1 Tax=Haloferula rosea TaxID=490093 RepID=A0A934R8K1_9BACT|nr:DUF1592 domain-containing protein [Haloferula rosea]MBK1826282.1 DUF1592 domain-containing protein [Haloferula rosea]
MASLLFSATHAEELEEAWKKEILPLFDYHCYECHGEGIKEGELALDEFDGIPSMQADRERWKRIRAHIDQRLMPPIDEEQPTSEERDKMVQWIDAAVFPVDPDKPDPGRVTLRRLNRIEYENTLKDLLGVRLELQELLPPDDSGYGFDNIGDVLTLSPAHMERFLASARFALEQTVHADPMPFPSRTIPGRKMEGGGHRDENGHFLFRNGAATTDLEFPKAGRYRISIAAGGTFGAKEGPQMIVRLDKEKLGSWEIRDSLETPGTTDIEVTIAKPGRKTLAAEFPNDWFDENYPVPTARDRNLLVHQVSLTGPLDGPRPRKPESHRRIYGERRSGESDEAWATRIFSRFARQAFRRPLEPGEAERYLHFIRLAEREGRDFEHGVLHGLEAILVSPSFLFREEPQPEPDNPERIHPINEHALASRLSYFIWSTMPDQALSKLADDGLLRANLHAEVERMLNSPKAEQFVSNFAGQWLQLRDLRSANPSRRAFPRFNSRLRQDMARETNLLFAHMIRENRPITDLIDADYTFVNRRLAKHYGIEGVESDSFERVSLSGSPRRGILGHGSFLLVTSHPLRTSPVLRGKFVLQNLLDMAPPPPPPNVPQLTPPEKHGKGLSLREQMEKHREDPGCASCHALMDPIGFGLQNFDADGSWRTKENGKPIDASGQLGDGQKFQGADDLRRLLLEHHREDFLRSAGSKMLTYALGRGTDWYDKPAIDRIVRETEDGDFGTRAMIHAVIRSVPFQYRRGEG